MGNQGVHKYIYIVCSYRILFSANLTGEWHRILGARSLPRGSEIQ